MNITELVESRFKNELANYFDDYHIKMYWHIKLEEYNPAFVGCAFRVRYIDTAYNDATVDIDVWEKRMSNDDYTFKFIIKDILEFHKDKIDEIIKRLDV